MGRAFRKAGLLVIEQSGLKSQMYRVSLILSRCWSGLSGRRWWTITLRPRLAAARAAAGTRTMRGRAMSMATRTALSGSFGELFFHGVLLLVIELPILVRIKLLEDFLLEFGLTGFKGFLHGSLFLVIELPILVRIKLGKHVLEVRVLTRACRSRVGTRSRRRSCFLSHDRHSGSHQCE